MGSTEQDIAQQPGNGRLEICSSRVARRQGLPDKPIAMTCLSYTKSGSNPKNNKESKGILDQHS